MLLEVFLCFYIVFTYAFLCGFRVFFVFSHDTPPPWGTFPFRFRPAELRTPKLPQIYLWEPDAYKDKVNSFTLYHGIVIGIAGLLALFLTMPYGKFVHGMYRWVALVRHHLERRRPVPGIAAE